MSALRLANLWLSRPLLADSDYAPRGDLDPFLPLVGDSYGAPKSRYILPLGHLAHRYARTCVPAAPLTYAEFGRLRLRDFLPSGINIVEQPNFEWMNGSWWREGIAFTWFGRLMNERDHTAGLELLIRRARLGNSQADTGVRWLAFTSRYANYRSGRTVWYAGDDAQSHAGSVDLQF